MTAVPIRRDHDTQHQDLLALERALGAIDGLATSLATHLGHADDCACYPCDCVRRIRATVCSASAAHHRQIAETTTDPAEAHLATRFAQMQDALGAFRIGGAS